MKKKIKKKDNKFSNSLFSIFSETINFLFKGSDIHNPFSLLLVLVFPFIALIGSCFLVIYRFFKILFRK